MANFVTQAVNSSAVNNIMVIGFWVVLAFFLLIVFGILTYFLIMNLKYKHFVVVRELSKDRKLIRYDKARDLVDDEGVKYWKLKKLKHTIPMPPPEAVEITTKGKMFVEVYKTPNDQYYYLKDEAEFDPDDRSLQPITTNQRAALANQIRKKFNRRLHKWTEYIPQIASGLMIVIILVIVFAFWGQIMKPSVQVAQANADTTEKISQAVGNLRDIIQKTQVINSSLPPPDRVVET